MKQAPRDRNARASTREAAPKAAVSGSSSSTASLPATATEGWFGGVFDPPRRIAKWRIYAENMTAATEWLLAGQRSNRERLGECGAPGSGENSKSGSFLLQRRAAAAAVGGRRRRRAAQAGGAAGGEDATAAQQ